MICDSYSIRSEHLSRLRRRPSVLLVFDDMADRAINADLVLNHNLYGGEGNDSLLGYFGNDTLKGGAGDDYLAGEAGDDLLDGGAGSNILRGGGGNDIYIVNGNTDTIEELVDAGTDEIRSSVSWSLAALAHVENLTLTGSIQNEGTGNALANVIKANNAGCILRGGAGNDTLLGGNNADVLFGDSGADRLVGGKGNDRYYLDSAKDVVVESAGQGTDRVFVTFDYTLGANLEFLEIIYPGLISVASDSSNRMRPWVGRSRPEIRFSSVVFPQPDGPNSA